MESRREWRPKKVDSLISHVYICWGIISYHYFICSFSSLLLPKYFSTITLNIMFIVFIFTIVEVKVHPHHNTIVATLDTCGGCRHAKSGFFTIGV